MNTELKKGDKCQSPFGIVIAQEDFKYGGIMATVNEKGDTLLIHTDELTRIPTHAERMQKMVDTAMDCENTLEPHETVQFTVEAFVEFARHYCLLREELEYEQSLFDGKKAIMEVRQREITKSLKGEL